MADKGKYEFIIDRAGRFHLKIDGKATSIRLYKDDAYRFVKKARAKAIVASEEPVEEEVVEEEVVEEEAPESPASEE